MRKPVLLAVVIAASIGTLAAQPFCSTAVDGTAAVGLTSPPFAHVSTVLELAEFYGSAATLGTPQVSITGNKINITQSNGIGWALPTTTCRVQPLTIGTLAPGRYEVSWVTLETFQPSLDPPTRTRVRTFAFDILPAEAIPASGSYASLFLAAALATLGVARMARSL